MSDDNELLRRYVENQDERAFTELVGRHLRLVFNTALRQVGADVSCAQDVSQVVFIDLARKGKSLISYPALGGWLYARTRHASLDALRSNLRRRTRENNARIMNEVLLESGHSADWESLRPVIDRALHALNERDRNAVYLHFFEGRPFGEVGARFGISEDATRKRIERAMEKLRRTLESRGVTSTTAALALAIANQAGAIVPLGLAESVAGSALAAAGSPATGAAALLHFMNTSKVAIGAALAAGMFMVGASFYEQKVIREARAALASESGEAAAISIRFRRIEKQLGQSEKVVSDLRAAESQSNAFDASRGSSTNAKRRSAASDSVSRPGGLSPLDRELSKDPEVRRNFGAFLASINNAVYGPLFKSLGWSPEKIASFENLQAQLNNDMDAATLTLRPDDVTRREITRQTQSLLGTTDYQAYAQYSATAWGGQLVASALAGNLYDTGSPLTAGQATQLAQILSASGPQGGTYTYPANINWDTALTQAQSILSAEQYSALQDIATVMTSSANGGRWNGLWTIAPGSFGSWPMPPPAVMTTLSGK